MYFFKPSAFSNFDPKNVNQFVECWENYYKFSVKKINSTELIDYFSEINLGNNLTKENVVNLLRWNSAGIIGRRFKPFYYYGSI